MLSNDATVVDFDDFSILNNRLGRLDTLKHQIPELKVTLFTVPFPANDREFPGRTPTALEAETWLRWVKSTRPWVELALHGWHHSALECVEWTRQQTVNALIWAEQSGLFVKGFKAPYWTTSYGLYAGLMERGWWIADHERNDAMRPSGLPCFKTGFGRRVHGHVQDIGSNGLNESWGVYTEMKPPFQFISEAMR